MIKHLILVFIILISGCSVGKKEVVDDKPIPWLKPGKEKPIAVFGRDKEDKVIRKHPVILNDKLMEFTPPDIHVVQKGECLWWIAEYKSIYGDPFKWPVIYKANRNQIKDPDLIYPGQELIIPR